MITSQPSPPPAEQANQFSNKDWQQLQLLVEAAPIPVSITRFNGTFVTANQACADLFGISLKDAINRPTPNYYHNPTDREAVISALQQDRYLHNHELQVRKADGTPFWVLLSLRVTTLGSEPVIFSGFYDITERKQIEAQLRASEERFRLLSAATFEGITINDKERILVANQAVADLFGYSPEELIGKPIKSFVTKESTPLVQKRISSNFQDPYETIGIRRDGSTFNLEIRGKSITYRGKEARVAALRDITEYKRTTEMLAMQNRTLEVLNNLSQKILSSLDLKAILQTVVQSIVEMLDVTSAYYSDWDAEKKTFIAIAEYYSPQASDTERVSDLGVPYTLDDFGVASSWLYDNKDSYVIYRDEPETSAYAQSHLEEYGGKSVLEVPVRVKGQPIGTLELWESRYKRDFSAEEISLVHSIARLTALAIENARLFDEAIQANQLKSNLLANVSHEFRTPLAAILGYSEMLQEEFYGPTTHEQGRVINNITDSANYLTRLVNDLLIQASLDANEIELIIKNFNPTTLAQQVVNELKVLTISKEVTLHLLVDDSTPIRVRGDHHRLKQVLQNLVGNAIKFTAQGQIWVKLGRVSSELWYIAVEDTGTGIPDDMKERIFEPFLQVEKGNIRRFGGTGLGLSIVRQLVEVMKGEISVESRLGGGSIFTVQLPVRL